MRLTLFILLFISIGASAQPPIKIIKNSAPAPVNAIKLTIVPNSTPAASGQVKISLSGGYSLLIDSTPTAQILDTFVLRQSEVTSAGVFKTDGTLIRTLWNNVRLPAGAYFMDTAWDGRDDAGNLVADGAYKIRVLHNNFAYTWEGGIGNTSDSLTGASKWRGFQGLYDMAINGNTAYFGVNYSEGWGSNYKVDLLHPQNKTIIQQGAGNLATGASAMFVCTDGITTYWASMDPNNPTSYSYIIAYNVSDDNFKNFTSGVPVDNIGTRDYSNAIDTSKTYGCVPTGIAVQKNGTYLFHAKGALNVIDVLDKNTGALVRTITTFTNPRSITIEGTAFLWMIYGTNTVGKFTINNDGSLTSTGITIPSLVSPLRLAVSKDTSVVAVLDGGTSQQVKAFNNATGGSLWTLGQAGGYQSDPTVYDDKLYVVDRALDSNYTFSSFIAFQTDGSFWVGDGGNYRAQHFASDRSYINNIMYYPHSYSSQVDPNNPTRVFNSFMEYQIDYSKPLGNGQNGSWKLVRNWRDGAPQGIPNQTSTYPHGYQYHMENDVFNNIVTLSNGRTYAFLFRPTSLNPTIPTRRDLFELPASGNMRYTGINFQMGVADRYFLMPDGSLKIFNYNGAQNGTYTWKTKALTGFDGSNNPTWSSTATTLATIPSIKDSDPYDPVGNNAITSGGILPSFDPVTVAGTWQGFGYHLAGIKTGDTAWRFRTSRSTFISYTGEFPSDEAFDIGNNVNGGGIGGSVWAIDSLILYNMHSEGWKHSQTNKWNLYHESGLMIGQFGVTSPDYPAGAPSPPMVAGNTFSGGLVKVNGSYYLYAAEESPQSFLHRWRIDNINSVGEKDFIYLKVGVPALAASPFEDMMANIPAYGTTFTSGTDGWTWDAIGPTDSSVISVINGTKVYKTGEHSIATKFQKANATFNIQKDLGTVNSSAWQVKGQAGFEGYQISWNNNDLAYIELLDNSDKIITQWKFQRSSPSSTNTDVYLNGSIIFSQPVVDFGVALNKFQDLLITPTTFTFGAYGTYTYSPFDGTADITKPKKFRIRYINSISGDNRTEAVNINNLKLKRN